ncbi:MAG: S8 family peptidase [Nitrosopumilus sp.]|nr:S8 family peptidase [Nitrosopumilus sp.]
MSSRRMAGHPPIPSARIILTIALSALFTGTVFADDAVTIGDDDAVHLIPDPNDNKVGPLGNTGASEKFDPGLYEKVIQMIEDGPDSSAIGVYDGVRYYDLILVVARDYESGKDPDLAASVNKKALSDHLEFIGARNITVAERLSFLTASIPVSDIPRISLLDEVHALGDGELPATVYTDRAMKTVRSTAQDITGAVGKPLNGDGVRLAILDAEILHESAFGDSIAGKYDCTRVNCQQISANVIPQSLRSSTHGTIVAQVAASQLSVHGGVAPGVDLLNVIIPPGETLQHRHIAHGLDWSLNNGADVVNLSAGIRIKSAESQSKISAITGHLIMNEAVDKGMVVVVAASNDGIGYLQSEPDKKIPLHLDYMRMTMQSGAHNVIAVGSINNDFEQITIANYSSRGPVLNTKILKPDIVAPGNVV